MTALYYCVQDRYSVEEAPSPTLVEERIRSLNNADLSVVGVFLPPWDLNIWGGHKGRVGVRFTKPDGSEKAILVDPDIPEDEQIVLFRQCIPENEPLNRTVTVDKAVEVALHFFNFGDFPEGLTWFKYPSSPPDWEPSKGVKTD